MDEQAAERRVEAEQLQVLRRQIMTLNEEKQATIQEAMRDLKLREQELSRCQARVDDLESQLRAQNMEVARMHDVKKADTSKITILEKQLITADNRQRELGMQLRSLEQQFNRAQSMHAAAQGRDAHMQQRQQQLMRNNKRLLKLLGATVQYHALGEDEQHSARRASGNMAIEYVPAGGGTGGASSRPYVGAKAKGKGRHHDPKAQAHDCDLEMARLVTRARTPAHCARRPPSPATACCPCRAPQ